MPPNPFSLVTYIATGSMDCAFCKSKGAMLLWQQLLELEGCRTPTLRKFPYPYGKWTSSVVSKSNIQTRWAEKRTFLEGSLRSQPQSYPLRYQSEEWATQLLLVLCFKDKYDYRLAACSLAAAILSEWEGNRHPQARADSLFSKNQPWLVPITFSLWLSRFLALSTPPSSKCCVCVKERGWGS